MKGYKIVNEAIVEVQVDVDKMGRPILSPDITIDPIPEYTPGYYLTIVNSKWVKLPVVAQDFELQQLKNEKLMQLKEYKDWLINQPIYYDNYLFDADELAKNRLTQALVIYIIAKKLPVAWITYDNYPYPIRSIDDLMGIIQSVYDAFNERFFGLEQTRQRIIACKTKEELELIEIPKKEFV